MISILSLAWRNALRNGRRSFLTAATVTIGTTFVVVSLSFLAGMMGGMVSSWTELNGPIRVVTTAYAEREQLAPLHENIAESAPLIARIAATPGVEMAEPMIRTGVIVSVGEEIGEDATLLTGSTDAWYRAHLLPAATLTGAWLDADAKEEQVVLGARVARDTGAQVGDSILLMGTTQYGSMAPISADVVGVITGNNTIDSQSYVTLETARWMVDVPDGALEVLVYPTDPSESGVGETASALRSSLGQEFAVTPWYDHALWRQTKPIVDGMDLILSGIIVFVMALAVFNTMTMSVLERTGEIGVMRAMGQTRLGAVTSFLCESLMIGLAGGVLGTCIGAVPALWLERNGVSLAGEALEDMGTDYPMTTTLYGDFSVDIVLTALLVGLSTAALGAALPALRAARIPPYEAMRSQR